MNIWVAILVTLLGAILTIVGTFFIVWVIVKVFEPKKPIPDCPRVPPPPPRPRRILAVTAPETEPLKQRKVERLK